tara:strand:+ start:2736 stop:2930 length:195 start_codon:yes stop_codon:yes gene_type:complete
MQAEIERLREALGRIKAIKKADFPSEDEDEYGFETCSADGYNTALQACQEIANAALSKQVGGEG